MTAPSQLAALVEELGTFFESGMRRFNCAPDADIQAVLDMSQRAMFALISAQTEQTMHAAWRKRAEEAEAALSSQEALLASKPSDDLLKAMEECCEEVGKTMSVETPKSVQEAYARLSSLRQAKP